MRRLYEEAGMGRLILECWVVPGLASCLSGGAASVGSVVGVADGLD